MRTYADLLADLSTEVGGDLPDNITQLIEEVETELWQDLYFCAPETIYTVSVPAGSSSGDLSPFPVDRWLQIRTVIDPHGSAMRRVSLSQFQRMSLQKAVPELYIWSWNPSDQIIRVYKEPASDASISLVVFERQPPLSPSDTSQTKFFLGDGYNVLKYGVLYKRIFNAEKFEMWRQRFAESYQRLVVMKARQRLSLVGGSPIVT